VRTPSTGRYFALLRLHYPSTCVNAEIATMGPSPPMLTDTSPPHSMNLLRCRPCWEMPLPPQSLRWLRLCTDLDPSTFLASCGGVCVHSVARCLGRVVANLGNLWETTSRYRLCPWQDLGSHLAIVTLRYSPVTEPALTAATILHVCCMPLASPGPCAPSSQPRLPACLPASHL